MSTIGLLALVISGFAASGTADREIHWIELLGNPAFESVLKYEDSAGKVQVAPFQLMDTPVSNAQFLAFVTVNPEWRRGAVPSVFAEARYLEHWSGPLTLGKLALPQQPVTRVSWFAAQAYCEAQQARLPTWSEW